MPNVLVVHRGGALTMWPWLARLFARFRRPVDTRVYKLDDPEQDGPAWVPPAYGCASDTIEASRPVSLLRAWRIEFLVTAEQGVQLLLAMSAKPPASVLVADASGCGCISASIYSLSGTAGGSARRCVVYQDAPDSGAVPFSAGRRSVLVSVAGRLSFSARVVAYTTPTGLEVTYA